MDIIYKIKSPIGKVYIGRTKHLKQRMIDHKHNAYTKKCNNSLYKAIRKYGWDNMIIEVVDEVDPEKSQQVEEDLIKSHNSVKMGYNDTYIGGGGDMWYGRRDTDEYMDWVENMKEVNSSNRMHGKHHKDTSIKKMKNKAKGRFSLEWYIERNGENLGTRLYEERCEKLRNRDLPRDENGKFIKKYI